MVCSVCRRPRGEGSQCKCDGVHAELHMDEMGRNALKFD